MADTEYTHGEMDITAQKGMWDGFMKSSVWGSLIIGMIVMYATLALTMPLNWMVALGLTAFAGVAIGMFMKMGGAWIATVIGLTGLAVFVQVLIMVFQLFM